VSHCSATSPSAVTPLDIHECVEGLKKFWIGHANRDAPDKYATQLQEDVDWRKNVADTTGLGFALSVSMEISVGQLGQPEMVGNEEAKAA